MLTAKELERAIAAHLVGTEGEIDVGGVEGLRLRIKASGAMSWTLRYRAAGRQRRVTLGRYPTVPLALARTEARKLLGAVAVGGDPSAERREGHHRRKGLTFSKLAERWTNGELARTYPDHVRPVRRVRDDETRLRLHILPMLGALPLATITLDDVDRCMAKLPAGLAPKTRRHVAQLVGRVLGLAVYPVRAIDHSPIPRGWLPRPGARRAKAYLYPDEEVKLLRCRDVPLELRLIWGVLGREGMRASEALALRWSDLDMKRGALTLDVNKTSDPRSWSLGDDVVKALQRWRALQPKTLAADAPVFVLPRSELRSDDLREALQRAGVTRPQLFEASEARMPMRVHDLRGTFVTLALACGRSESWVCDRTGHRSSQMIALYKRSARTAGELELGWLKPLHAAIPELAAKPAKVVALADRRRRK